MQQVILHPLNSYDTVFYPEKIGQKTSSSDNLMKKSHEVNH